MDEVVVSIVVPGIEDDSIADTDAGAKAAAAAAAAACIAGDKLGLIFVMGITLAGTGGVGFAMGEMLDNGFPGDDGAAFEGSIASPAPPPLKKKASC